MPGFDFRGSGKLCKMRDKVNEPVFNPFELNRVFSLTKYHEKDKLQLSFEISHFLIPVSTRLMSVMSIRSATVIAN
jgi:hypothetical protein